MRLNQFIARSGLCSRRHADRLIAEGRVTVNGKRACVGEQVQPEQDHVKVDGKLVQPSRDHVYILLYKPTGYLCSLKDPGKRPLVTDLLREFRGRRLFTIGRLDFNSEGLILITDDGDFAAHVGHPSTGPEKTYQVRARGVPDEKILNKIRTGITVGGIKTRPARVRLLRAGANSWLEVRLKEGRNRQIRRIFQALGHPVVRLRRTAIGAFKIGAMKPGQFRLLTSSEVDRLSKS